MLQPDGENSIVIVGGANVEGWGQALLLGGESGSGGGGKRGDGGSNDDDDDDDDNATTPPPPVSVSPEFGALLLQREVPEAVNAAYARAAVASGVRVVLGEFFEFVVVFFFFACLVSNFSLLNLTEKYEKLLSSQK